MFNFNKSSDVFIISIYLSCGISNKNLTTHNKQFHFLVWTAKYCTTTNKLKKKNPALQWCLYIPQIQGFRKETDFLILLVFINCQDVSRMNSSHTEGLQALFMLRSDKPVYSQHN